MITGWLIGLVGVIGVAYMVIGIKNQNQRIQEESVAVGGFSLVILMLAICLEVTGRRLKHTPADDIVKIDKRPPILYLRSFNFDRFNSRALVEENLAYHLRQLGPPICIGKPGEWLPRAGFHRIYVPHDQWQQQVKLFLHQAQCIVFVHGGTQGLAWELKTIVATMSPTKLLLLIKLRHYHHLKRMAETIMQKQLPPLSAFYVNTSHCRADVGAIMFDENWQAIPLTIKLLDNLNGNVWWYHKLTFQRLPMDLLQTVQPFVDRARDANSPSSHLN